VADFIGRYVLGSRHSAYPVERVDGTVAGLVTLAQLREVPVAARDATRLIDIASPVPMATPQEPLALLLERLADGNGSRALVFGEGESVGIITPTDIARAVQTTSLRVPASPVT